MSELLATGYCDVCGKLWSPGHKCPKWAIERKIEELENIKLTTVAIINGMDEYYSDVLDYFRKELEVVNE